MRSAGIFVLSACAITASPKPNDILHISVEGWRHIQHSYAVVNQFQLLELLKRRDVRLSVVDRPYYRPWWRPTEGLFSRAEHLALSGIPTTRNTSRVADARGGGGSGSGGRGRQGQGAGAGPPDAVLRITYPMDLRPAPHGVPTWVFGTTELQLPLHEMRGAGSPDWSELHKLRSHVGILTPSGWSAHGFRNGGVHASRLRIVPHGVDPRIFRPASPARRRELRAARGWTGHAVFLTVGSRAGSKGIPDLIRAFRGVHEAHPHAKLVLKLADGVYNSSAGHGELRRSATLLASGAIEYVGESLSFSRMAELYQAADAYVSPYRGEGFNIPVLEAAACGLPVVVTRGGATEDYILDSFALRVSSELAEVSVGDGGDGASPRQGRHPAVGEAAARQMGRWLLPNPEHLRVQMVRAMHDEELVARARREAPKHVHSRFSWAAAVDRLVAALRESVQNSRRKRGAQRGEEDESETCIE